MFLEARRVVPDGGEVRPAQGERDTGGGGLGGEVPEGVRVQQGVVTEAVAVAGHADHGLVAVLTGADLVDLAVRDQEDAVGGLALGDEHLAGAEVPLLAAVGQGGQHLLVLVAAQQGQLAQLGRDHPDLGTGLDELHHTVAHGVGEPPVDPVGRAGGLHPGEHLEQPAGGDLLHLRCGLGRGRKVTGSGRRKALLLDLLCLRGRVHGHRQGLHSCGRVTRLGPFGPPWRMPMTDHQIRRLVGGFGEVSRRWSPSPDDPPGTLDHQDPTRPVRTPTTPR